MRGIYLALTNGTIISGNFCSRNNIGIECNNTSARNSNFGNWIVKNVVGSISDNGTSNNIHDNIFITNPVAAFTASTFAIANTNTQFTDATTNCSLPLSYQWNFGDGAENSTLQNPTHQFSSTGTFTITLLVIDADNETSIYQINITVEPPFNPSSSNNPPNSLFWVIVIIAVLAISVLLIAMVWKLRRSV